MSKKAKQDPDSVVHVYPSPSKRPCRHQNFSITWPTMGWSLTMKCVRCHLEFRATYTWAARILWVAAKNRMHSREFAVEHKPQKERS